MPNMQKRSIGRCGSVPANFNLHSGCLWNHEHT